ncbi:MAG: hypothetical protein NT023_24495 [Armatimonadetes bacterium]|nr:hypothetical protein [Armatimonadota bacterium]
MKVHSTRMGLPLVFMVMAISLVTSPLSARLISQKKTAKPNADNAKKAEPRRLLILPIDTPDGKAEALTDALNSIVQKRFTEKDLFAITIFEINSPLIKRATIDRQLERKDLKKPFDNVVKAKKIAGVLGFNLVLLIAVNDYQYDEAKRQVTLDISLRIVDFSSEKPKVEKYVAETATSSTDAPKDKDEAKLAADLLTELTEKLVKDMLKAKTTEEGKK